MEFSARSNVRLVGTVGLSVFAISGCAEIFGFESPIPAACLLPSDCPEHQSCEGNVCTPECVTQKDCEFNHPDTPFCQDNVCVAGPTVVDAGVDAAVDALADASATDAASACATACPEFSSCDHGLCDPGQQVGPYGGADGGGFGVLTSVAMYCSQIDVPVCGTLTGVGLALRVSSNADVRLAVYEDQGGSPTGKLAETPDVSLNGAGIDSPVVAPAMVGCDRSATFYWVCLASSDTLLTLDTIPNSGAPWVEVTAPPEQVQGWIDEGLPQALSHVDRSTNPVPLLYVWVAQSSN